MMAQLVETYRSIYIKTKKNKSCIRDGDIKKNEYNRMLKYDINGTYLLPPLRLCSTSFHLS
jgi:hypothetical protein